VTAAPSSSPNFAGTGTERRWPIIAALGITQIFTWGSSYYLLAVLASPISKDTGWSIVWITGSLSLGLLVAGLASPKVGRMIGLRGGRTILAAACIILAVGLAILGLAPNLVFFALGWVILGVGMGAGLYDAAFSTLGRLYGSSARRSITALTLWAGFSSTICWPLSAFFVDSLGWRGACFAYAAILILMTLPLVLWFIPPVPASTEAARAASSPSLELLPSERLPFLLIACVFTLCSITMSVVSVHLLTLLEAAGISLATAVATGTVIGPSQVAARIVEAAGRDRHHPLWTLTASVGMIAAGLVLLWAGFQITALSLVLYGAGNGLFSIAKGTLPLSLFGPERYSTLMGRLAFPSLIAQALAPWGASFLLAHGGAAQTFTALAITAVANIALVATLWLTRAKVTSR
jgi:MFS family permease